ncbi:MULTISPECIES: hypothetical protein [Planktothricoides]|uniref:Uncharacterized protein n=2 Tax=Planktothricoides raciborskii TaxID=132608 RepID=A0AAU8JMK0_9CYAN|nr:MULTISPECIES: hypothetical protein [Planktothricoides]KOR34835.1 hypothetical protein AM228_21945 [Planktothricoides sp. SR001]MBD2545333.1 hypothetical protein [Planktothricoides raciborskii FACHB-1370]MBD2583242.1 hypothetical protein [Planktothricoides raciborskii FACHB-1261]
MSQWGVAARDRLNQTRIPTKKQSNHPKDPKLRRSFFLSSIAGGKKSALRSNSAKHEGGDRVVMA